MTFLNMNTYDTYTILFNLFTMGYNDAYTFSFNLFTMGCLHPIVNRLNENV